ncbi:S-adenosyl-L-methionine-dependent methyltransferase [Pavlovales sp. CCMP2436]|nr:S-adenosyl-L-methionine-dependent methyltransferase [Pavlovales sp. CCMP2436]
MAVGGAILRRLRAGGAGQRALLSSTPDRSLLNEVVQQIRFRGPMTFVDYMRTCLTHPAHGYYMKRDVFGRGGDFITGPEISQVYGELVGVWVVAMWRQMGEPRAVRIVEAGPGRGTLMSDMLRVIARHEHLARGARLDLIEVSPWMRKRQREVLCAVGSSDGGALDAPVRTRDGGLPVSWHDSLRDLLAPAQPDSAVLAPSGLPAAREAAERIPSIFIAHEFLDALPVHKFRRAPATPTSPVGPWREVLVDVSDEVTEDPSATGAHQLRFVLAPAATPAAVIYGHLLPPTPPATPVPAAAHPAPLGRPGVAIRRLSAAAGPLDGEVPAEGIEVEVCPLALDFATAVARELAASRGAALMIDYGPTHGPVADSARAIIDHRFVQLLEQPGDADLSALVDFGALRDAVRAVPGITLGAIGTQRELLGGLGLEARVNALLKKASAEEARTLVAAAERLVAVPGMGEEYKALAFCDEQTGTPVAFREG